MATVDKLATIPPELMAEMKEHADRASRGIRDPEDMRNALERMDSMREMMQETDIAVQLIREGRDALREIGNLAHQIEAVLAACNSEIGFGGHRGFWEIKWTGPHNTVGKWILMGLQCRWAPYIRNHGPGQGQLPMRTLRPLGIAYLTHEAVPVREGR